jgi:two-component system CheB/CheR fusion protein
LDSRGILVGIGASAGGLEALEGFLRTAPVDAGLTFIVVQHLSPDHKSHMVELLAKHSPMRIVLAEHQMRLEPNTVFLIPPKKVLSVDGDALCLEERGAGLALPIDVLFNSIAEQRGANSVAIVLSGTGSDGTRGLQAIARAGGLVLVQDPTTAKFDGMPRSAIATGLVDHVLSVGAMAPMLLERSANSPEALVAHGTEDEAEMSNPAYARVTAILKRRTGVDFGQYKPSTVSRRIRRRMGLHHLESIEAYADLLQGSTREVNLLFQEMLINVTRFFRDPEAFETLAREAIPAIVDKTRAGEAVRVWVAGCATGEEAYSLAILFEEHVNAGGRPREVKIFATDIDRDALEFAGNGVYPETIRNDVSQARLDKFFTFQGGQYQVSRSIRQRVVFANHDLTSDPPFGRVSLVTCRNLLIYFAQEMQQQVISGFRFSLRPGGFLFLGGSETPGELGAELEPFAANAKIFRRTEVRPRIGHVNTKGMHSPTNVGGTTWPIAPPKPAPADPRVVEGYEALVAAYVPPSALITEHHEVLHLFGEPSPLLRFSPGATTLNLLQLVPSNIASIVGLATHRALRTDSDVSSSPVPTDFGPTVVAVRPVPSRSSMRLLAVSFTTERASEVLAPATNIVPNDAERQIVALQQELRYSRENLQATIEELETSNEELQATNEEMAASNEELQSVNEELQSVNEELHTLNAEYQQKIMELVRLNDDIDNLLLSTRLGTLFLDQQLNVTRFTPAIQQYMALLDRDVGRPISHIALRFDTKAFFDTLEEVRQRRVEVERELSLESGHPIVLRVAPYVTESSSHAGLVVTVLDASGIARAERRMARVLDAVPFQVALLDRNGVITMVNRAWADFAERNGGSPESTGVGVDYLAVSRASLEPDKETVVSRLEDLLSGRRRSFDFEYPCHSISEERWFMMQAKAVAGDDGGIVVCHVNITNRKRLERELGAARANLSRTKEAQ